MNKTRTPKQTVGNQRPTVVFDCDDVLVNLRDPMSAMLNRIHGTEHPWPEWSAYDLIDRFGMTVDTFCSAMIEHRVLDQVETETGAENAIERARSAGYAVEVWTARGWYPDAEQLTRRQMGRIGVAPDEIRLFGINECKARFALDHGGIDILIEDNPGPADYLARANRGCRAALVTRPWNQAEPLLRGRTADHALAQAIAEAA